MFKNFIIKKMLKKQGLPDAQIDMFLKMMEKDPDLFTKIAKEMEEGIKQGEDRMAVGMRVMKKYENDLKKLI